MAIKLDLEKAYDRLNWEFISETLKLAQFDDHLLKLVRQCTCTSTMKILWNGGMSSALTPSRGIRQGDSLSPYLFVLCMDRLTHVIKDAITDNTWKPVKLGRSGLSHLFFASFSLLKLLWSRSLSGAWRNSALARDRRSVMLNPRDFFLIILR